MDETFHHCKASDLTLVVFLEVVMSSATHRFKKSILLVFSIYKQPVLIFEYVGLSPQSAVCYRTALFVYRQTDRQTGRQTDRQTGRFVFNHICTPLLERISSPSLAVHYPRRTSASLVVLRPSLICAICLKVTFIILLISFSASSFHPTLGLLLGCLWYRLS